MNRRAFINRWTRMGILAAMAVTTGLLFSRRQVTLEQECGTGEGCRACTKLQNCGYPEAVKTRGDEKG